MTMPDPSAPIEPTIDKTKRTRKTTTPRAKRKRDPGIAAINERRNLEVSIYLSKKASAKIVETFLTKRLPKIMPEGRQKIFDVLCKTETRKLNLEEMNAGSSLTDAIAQP